MNWKIWIWVPVLYGLFSLWYFNWQGPLTEEEIEKVMQGFDEQKETANTDKAMFRKFLEEDDGDEFVMLNQVELIKGSVRHPVLGEANSASDILNDYFGPFSIALLGRGGHPVFQARTVGGNIDTWNADANESFEMTAMMRYKSRRDIVELFQDPMMADAHRYKIAAIERTVSYPTRVEVSSSLRPPVSFALILVLVASLAQNFQFALARKRGDQ